MKTRLLLIILCMLTPYYATAQKQNEFTVLQWNIWQEGTMIEGGFEAIADEVAQVDADIVFFSEVRNYNGTFFISRIIEALKKRGKTYYGEHNPLDVGILSKYNISQQEIIYPNSGCGSILKATIGIAGHTIAVYSAHLDYKNYACYLPRGYNGSTWKKMTQPVHNADSILAANRIAFREEAIEVFIENARQDIAEGAIVLLGGDFNEPSHLDWQEDTKDLWDHNGVVINWDCSSILCKEGFKDTYRTLYPNPITHPGFTFPSDNDKMPVSKLTWAPDADERDRIDFIYFYPNQDITPISSMILGPSRSIVKSQRIEENTEDNFITPKGIWPSDHKGIIATFRISPQ